MKIKDERVYYVFVISPGEYAAKFNMMTRTEGEKIQNTGSGEEMKTLKIPVGTPFSCSLESGVSKNGEGIKPLHVRTDREGSSVVVYSGFQPGDVVCVGS